MTDRSLPGYCAAVRLAPAPLLVISLALPARPARAMRRYDHAEHPPAYYDRFVRPAASPTADHDRACLKRLRSASIRHRLLTGVRGVRTPVEVLASRLGGVRYQRHATARRRFILDCRLVEALAALGPRLRRAGVASVHYSSSWRYSRLKGRKELSQHAHGLALDVVAIDGRFGYATVIHHWETGISGCGEKNRTAKGRAWRRFHCAIRRAFGRVYTPDTDDDHRDHLHLERPDPALRLEPRPPSRWLHLGLILGGLLALSLLGVGIALHRARRPGRARAPDPPESEP